MYAKAVENYGTHLMLRSMPLRIYGVTNSTALNQEHIFAGMRVAGLSLARLAKTTRCLGCHCILNQAIGERVLCRQDRGSQWSCSEHGPECLSTRCTI